MDEDETLYKKLKCWCNNNEYEKTNAIEDGEATIAKATAEREKELQEFHGIELDNVLAIENLKAAITVLSKHNGESTTLVRPTRAEAEHALSFLGVGRKTEPWKD